MGRSLPLYRALTSEDLRKIDETGRRILDRIGLRILDSEFLDRLDRLGARVEAKDQRVRLDSGWLEEMLARAPSRITLSSRDGQNDLLLGEGQVHFGNGGRVFRILDMATGGYRRTMLRDVANTAKLVHRLDRLRFYIIACQAHDVDPEHYHLNDFYCAFNHTTKHVMGGCDTLEGAQEMWKLASFLAGGDDKLRERPFVSVITNVISPLTLDGSTLHVLEFAASHGLPVTCAPAPIAGATSPASLAGTLAQLHAEALGAVAITQALAPGAKSLYGAVATAMDLRTMEYTMGSVEMGMMNAAAVQLAKLYNLPIYASGGLTEAKRPDLQAGVEKLFSNLTVAMTGADLVHLAAGLIDSGNSIAYEQYVIDNEVLGMVHRQLEGIEVSDETLGYDVIESVGPGGNYVMEDHTIDHMMKEFYYPRLSVRCNFDIWEERGRPDMLSRSTELVRQILDEGEEGLLDPELILRMEETFPGLQKLM